MSETVNTPMPGAEAPVATSQVAPQAPQGSPPVAAGETPKAPAEAPQAAPEAPQAAPPSDLTAKPPEAPVAEPIKGEDQKAAEAAVGFDLTQYATEFTEKGALSPESYKTLAEKGFNEQTVNTYIQGVQAQAQQRGDLLATVVGGVDNYNAIITWGKGALTDAEKQQAVKVLSDPNAETAKTYLAGLNARFVKENGKAPGKISGGGGAASEDTFKDRGEQAAAMADPRYSKDAKYRREVMDRSIRSFRAPVKKRAKVASKKAASASRRRAKSAR